MYAKNVACNLLSLSKLADIGLSIYLNKEIIRIYDENTEADFLTGKYVKPNWLIRFNDIKSEVDKDRCEYECSAMLISTDDFSTQPQTTNPKLSTSEGADNHTEDHSSEVRSEKGSKIVSLTTHETVESGSIDSNHKNEVGNLDDKSHE